MDIAGHHIPHQKLWLYGGIIAAGVAVVVFLRARAASAAADQGQPAAQPDQGASMSIPAGSSDVANSYQQQLDNAQLQAQTIANTYQSNLVGQQQKQFDLQQSLAEQLAPSVLQQQQAALAVQTHFDTAASKAPVSCPGSASLRTGPDGQLYCRQKTSGGFLGIPLGDIARTVQNFVGGVEAAAPTIGYQAAQQAASYYTGQFFPQKPAAVPNPTTQARAATPVTPISPVTATPVPHGYAEIA